MAAVAAQTLKAQKRALRKTIGAALGALSLDVIAEQCKYFLYPPLYPRCAAPLTTRANYAFLMCSCTPHTAHAIAARVLELPVVRRAGAVSCYMSMPIGEARTQRIAEGILASGECPPPRAAYPQSECCAGMQC